VVSRGRHPMTPVAEVLSDAVGRGLDVGKGAMDGEDRLNYQFDLVIPNAIGDDDVDALFDAGCDDASPEIDTSSATLHFDRTSSSLGAAIVSAVLDVEGAGLRVAGVGAPDLVDLPEVAARTGRTRESVRLLALGRRGPGGFPSLDHGFYSWAEVRAWFAEYDPASVGSPDAAALHYDRVIAAADHLVRARALIHGHDEGLAALIGT
jgi:hypothetical protein